MYINYDNVCAALRLEKFHPLQRRFPDSLSIFYLVHRDLVKSFIIIFCLPPGCQMQIDRLLSTLFNQHQPKGKQCLPQGKSVCFQYVEINLSRTAAVSVYGSEAALSDSFRRLWPFVTVYPWLGMEWLALFECWRSAHTSIHTKIPTQTGSVLEHVRQHLIVAWKINFSSMSFSSSQQR